MAVGRDQKVRAFAARHRNNTASGISARKLCLAGILVTLLLAVGVWGYALYHVTVKGGNSDVFVKVESAEENGLGRKFLLRNGELFAPGESAGERTKSVEALGVDQDPMLVLYQDADCAGEILTKISAKRVNGSIEETFYGLCNWAAGSMRLLGVPEADFYSSCSRPNHYTGTLMESEGCVRRYNYPVVQGFRFVEKSSLDRKQISQEELDAQWQMQDHKPPNRGIPKARIVFSCESSEYFSYQVWANFYGYLSSGQKSASWTRLLTAGTRDDLPDVLKGLATFQAKRTLYSRRYSPINKPDVIAKWYASPDRPLEEVIVVIDPDNWLLKDLSPYVDMVSRGNAVGEPAYYYGSKSAQKLWKEFCEANCELEMDLVGVPYVVHRDDLAVIAPLWRKYTIALKDRADKDKDFKDRYSHLDLNWAAEMFGYNMASAHAGVKHQVVRRIQVRDVDHEHSKEKLQDVAMIHVGRAWFPKDYPPAQRWAHTEGKSFSHFGQQVWCKCNYTASTVMPWPVPPDADFQSTKTLELMHYSIERFGPIPRNPTFRRGSSPGTYGISVD